jgi:Uma2 family endonuclease
VYPAANVDGDEMDGYRVAMGQIPLTIRRWQRAEYDRLIELGVFEGEPLELIGGQLVVAEPKGTYHTSAVVKVDYALRAALPPGWLVRTQAPVWLDDESEPEPDLVVVPGAPDDYREVHPSGTALLIEVADSSLSFDRRVKGSLYARAGVADYWIVNLVDRVVELYREPVPDAAAVHGWSFRSVARVAPPATVTPMAFPALRIAVADLLPR